jgi:hypothetical protein
MIGNIRALILHNGNLVRTATRPETGARDLAQVRQLADYQVVYWIANRARCVTGEGFFALYEAGRILSSKPVRERRSS